MLAGQLALTLAALFTGAAIYINLVEQPARLGLDDRSLLQQWKPAYERGFRMQASLALGGGVLGLIAAYELRDWRWAPSSSSATGPSPCSSSCQPIAVSKRPNRRTRAWRAGS